LLKPSDLAGYRNAQVFIRRSMHVPLNPEALRDAYLDLLREEAHPAVRVVPGHFIFVYIHPYFDGNGRMGRFLMNVTMALGRISLDGCPCAGPQPLCRSFGAGKCGHSTLHCVAGKIGA